MAESSFAKSPPPFPDFYLIGSAKAGTTTLVEYLARHPQIAFSRAKEPEILRWEISEEKAERSYAHMFKEARPGQIRGEGSTCYTGWAHWRSEDQSETRVTTVADPAAALDTLKREIEETAARIARFTPQARLIYLVRHPVDRSYSHVQFNTRKATVPTVFEDALKSDPRYLLVSHYAEILRLYLKHIARSQILVATLDDLSRDPNGVLRQIQEFLGVTPDASIAQQKVNANEGRAHDARRGLSQRLRSIPGYPLLIKLVPARVREQLFNSIKSTPWAQSTALKAAPMLPATRAQLLEHFRIPNQELRDLTGLDLSRWER